MPRRQCVQTCNWGYGALVIKCGAGALVNNDMQLSQQFFATSFHAAECRKNAITSHLWYNDVHGLCNLRMLPNQENQQEEGDWYRLVLRIKWYECFKVRRLLSEVQNSSSDMPE